MGCAQLPCASHLNVVLSTHENPEKQATRTGSPGPAHLVIQEAYLEDVLHVRGPLGHGEVPHGISQQEDVGSALELLEVTRVLTHGAVLVVRVDELALEAPQEALNI